MTSQAAGAPPRQRGVAPDRPPRIHAPPPFFFSLSGRRPRRLTRLRRPSPRPRPWVQDTVGDMDEGLFRPLRPALQLHKSVLGVSAPGPVFPAPAPPANGDPAVRPKPKSRSRALHKTKAACNWCRLKKSGVSPHGLILLSALALLRPRQHPPRPLPNGPGADGLVRWEPARVLNLPSPQAAMCLLHQRSLANAQYGSEAELLGTESRAG